MDVSSKIKASLVNRKKDLQIYYPGNDGQYYITNISNYLDGRWREIYPVNKTFSASASPANVSNTPPATTSYTGEMKIKWRATHDGT